MLMFLTHKKLSNSISSQVAALEDFRCWEWHTASLCLGSLYSWFMVGLAMQELIKSSFFWFFRGDGSGIVFITLKKPGLSPAFLKTLYFIFISLGLCLFFLLKVSRKTPFLNEASAVDKSAFSGTS